MVNLFDSFFMSLFFCLTYLIFLFIFFFFLSFCFIFPVLESKRFIIIEKYQFWKENDQIYKSEMSNRLKNLTIAIMITIILINFGVIIICDNYSCFLSIVESKLSKIFEFIQICNG